LKKQPLQGSDIIFHLYIVSGSHRDYRKLIQRIQIDALYFLSEMKM